ncbi:PH domain-containing protein [Cryobacterium sp. TMT1-3]|uniref:PH domain-containing protein n=1 Tax=Cryobacterium luteum TaxID=1424661 RepID=A0A5F0D5U9_9MICO|nr:PH domain-containing protein [Cryobacterium luteum]TFC29569.1 PH domain-containing protein [Cryobacterium sp. TMT1-3]
MTPEVPVPDLPDVNQPGALPPVPHDVAESADRPEPSARLELPETGDWMRVSPKYVLVEIVGTIVNAVVVCGGASLLWLLLDQTWALWVGIAVLVASIINLVFEPRRVRSIGYLLRGDDLLFRRGILFQRFVAVPYGRMQLIDITRGPIARWLGLADLKFVTAAATAGVSIPGLAEADAESLRDRLVELAESRRAGL